MEFKELFQKHTLACLAGGFVIGVAVCGIGSAAMAFSGSPAFCGSCHAMKSEAATFAMSSIVRWNVRTATCRTTMPCTTCSRRAARA